MAEGNDKPEGGFRGPMERQQNSGGRHDRLSNARQRESGSSRGEADFTQGRQRDEAPDPSSDRSTK
jgi:hypothetical protein